MRDTIVKAMAKAIHVSAWASLCEEEEGKDLQPRAWAQQDWMDHSPEVTEDAERAAWVLLGKVENMNGWSIYCMTKMALDSDLSVDGVRTDGASDSYYEDFGHYLAMMALGTGVSWFDDHEKFPLKVPHIEFHYGLMPSGEVEASW
jgi:hypothetical protein